MPRVPVLTARDRGRGRIDVRGRAGRAGVTAGPPRHVPRVGDVVQGPSADPDLFRGCDPAHGVALLTVAVTGPELRSKQSRASTPARRRPRAPQRCSTTRVF